jgi:hypothetical protein
MVKTKKKPLETRALGGLRRSFERLCSGRVTPVDGDIEKTPLSLLATIMTMTGTISSCVAKCVLQKCHDTVGA